MRAIVLYSLFVWLSASCSPPASGPVEPPASSPAESPADTAPAVAPAAPARSASATPAASPLPAGKAAPAPAPASAAGHDFAEQAKLLYRIAACGREGPVDARFPQKAIDRHCAKVHRIFERFRGRWARRAGAFIAKLRPPDVPDTVVYPFGGGDLVTALLVYPDAREITTISLEAAGDPRTIDNITRKQLIADLRIIRGKYERLLRAAYSTTKSLQIASHSKLAGTVMFALSALSLHGYEPVSLRYFDIEPDGSLRYLDTTDLDARADARRSGKPNKKKYKTRQHWREQVAVFANMEIQYRARASSADRPVRVYRHIVANLDDPHLIDDPRPLAHLRTKGDVAVMTKAASYLLWLDEFSQIRQYLLTHAAWMISDSSGVPPDHARAAGYEQIPYGIFDKPFFTRDPKRVAKQMIALWQESPQRALGFRFGYPDGDGRGHLMIMRRRQ